MSAASGAARPQAGTDPRPPGPPSGRDTARPAPPGVVPPGSVPASRPPANQPPAGQPPASQPGGQPAASPASGAASRPAGYDPAGAHPAGPRRPAPAPPKPNTAAACRVFAAQPIQLAHARRFIAGVLSGFGAADDIILCVCELASNAVLHSCSREPGGQFTVRISVSPGGRIRAEVVDRGGPWNPEPARDEERGRGLLIVDALATRWGVTGSDAGRSAWLELDPPSGSAIP
jgi:serine/threonine-protein kinase RsbW